MQPMERAGKYITLRRKGGKKRVRKLRMIPVLLLFGLEDNNSTVTARVLGSTVI